MGSGAFGLVYRATAEGIGPNYSEKTTVAVKTTKSRSCQSQIKSLRSEVKIMIHIGRHMNIVNILGVCSKELSSKGNLSPCKFLKVNLLNFI